MKKLYFLLIFLMAGMVFSSQLSQAQSMDPSGNSERGFFSKAIEQASFSKSMLSTDWVSLGPDGGDVLDICIDLLNTNRVFAAAGVPYLSEDGGENWAIMNELASLASGQITSFEANLNGIIIAGGLYNYGKLYRSTDEGLSWSTVYYPLSSAYILDATIDPTNPDIMYLALTANGTSSRILIKSIDAGLTWSLIDLISVMPNGWSLVNIVVDPNNNQNLYAIGNESFSNAMVVASFDGGDTWSDITGNLPTGKPYNKLAVSGGSVYLAGGQLFGGQTLGIYKTMDNGASWQNISGSFPNKVANHILIDPSDANTLYVATEGDGVYYSNNGGTSWNFDGIGAGENGSARFLAMDPGNNQLIYAGFLSLAVCKSTDAALNWEYANKGIATLLLNDIEVNTSNPEQMLVAFEGENSGGCYLSSDGGQNWELVSALPATRYSQVAYGADGSLYAWSNGPTTVAAEGLYKSTDGGINWSNTGPNMGSSFETQVFSLCVSETNPDLFFVGGNNFGSFGWDGILYRSQDGGATWDNVFQGPENDSFKYLFIDPNSNDEIVYAAYKSDGEGGFLKSPDGGTNWLPISNGIPPAAHWCSVIIADPVNANILYGGAGGYGGQAGKIYRSENAGGTWEYANLTLGSNYSKVTDMMISPENNGVIYAATSSDGVYMSSDTSASWALSNENMPATSITGLSNPFLKDEVWKFCAATFTNSAFITDVYIPGSIGINSLEAEKDLFTVYPNPSNGSFTIEFGEGLSAAVVTKILNQQGQVVYQSSTKGNAGNCINVNANLPAGIWMLQVISGHRSHTERILVY